MFNATIMSYDYKENQTFSKNINERIEKFFKKEAYTYLRYFSMVNYINRLFADDQKKAEGTIYHELRSAILVICDILDENWTTSETIKLGPREMVDILYEYISKSKSNEFQDNIDNIYKMIENYRQNYTHHFTYSFHEAIKLLKKKDISLDDACLSIKYMLFARDYLDINAIKYLRSYIRNSKYIAPMINFNEFNENLGNDLLGLLFSDYKIIEYATSAIYSHENMPDYKKIDFNIDKDSRLNLGNFDLVCYFIYLRYIICVYIFIIQSDYTDYFKNNLIERILLKLYHKYSFMIFSSIYQKFTMTDFILFTSTQILDDFCVYMSRLLTADHINEAHSLASAIMRDSGHENYDKIINEYLKEIKRKFPHGSENGHKFMIESIKSSEKFAEYFKKRGFESNLNKKLIEMCCKKGVKDPRWQCVIGKHIHPGRPKNKKKES